MSKCVKDIILEHLNQNGFDGLVNDGGCGCALEDFSPCGEMQPDCEPAYKWTPEQAAAHEIPVENDYEDYKFIMYTEKP